MTEVITPTFEDLFKSPEIANTVIAKLWGELENDGTLAWIKEQLKIESSFKSEDAYPGQGLVVTGYEDDDKAENLQRQTLSEEFVDKTLQAWLFYLLILNHPERLKALFAQSEQEFQPLEAVKHPVFTLAEQNGEAIVISDLRLTATGSGGSEKPRVHRTELHKSGLFVSYRRSDRDFRPPDSISNQQKPPYNQGRKQARNVIVGAANPEVTGSQMALATLAQSHCLVCIPRDGYFSDIQRQVDLVHKTHDWFVMSPVLKGKNEDEKNQLIQFWQHNLIGVLEADAKKALVRANALYEAGVRTFRIYSPEPSSSPLHTLKALRVLEKEKSWEPIEIFVGQVVDVQQGIDLEEAGANALYFGIGGGGRCITGEVAGLTIDWPQLVWSLRGKIGIPMIVEGGANDHLAASMAVGATGIGTAGKFAGTIETPGGYLFLVDQDGEMFKYYGGEASKRMRIMANRFGPLDYILHIEGRTRRKELRHRNHMSATLLQVLHEIHEGIVASLVFQNTERVASFQAKAPYSLRRVSVSNRESSATH